MKASIYDHVEVVTALLDHGADVDKAKVWYWAGAGAGAWYPCSVR